VNDARPWLRESFSGRLCRECGASRLVLAVARRERVVAGKRPRHEVGSTLGEPLAEGDIGAADLADQDEHVVATHHAGRDQIAVDLGEQRLLDLIVTTPRKVISMITNWSV
jgi:hypothetical protein